ncbi:MAG: hypothetical protein MZV70_07025 [Desulfobacterales bacterium]|nr:hypothetical protein [Desulfobacterales bacterium]
MGLELVHLRVPAASAAGASCGCSSTSRGGDAGGLRRRSAGSWATCSTCTCPISARITWRCPRPGPNRPLSRRSGLRALPRPAGADPDPRADRRARRISAACWRVCPAERVRMNTGRTTVAIPIDAISKAYLTES